MNSGKVRLVVATLVGVLGVLLVAVAPASQAMSGRVLSSAEAAGLTGGLCHDCVNCRDYPANCVNLGVNNCPTGCGTGDNYVRGTGTIKQKCVTSGPLAGGCGEEVNINCLDNGDTCECTANPPNWACTRRGGLWVSFPYKRDPCQ
jgi:hypothetical protein